MPVLSFGAAGCGRVGRLVACALAVVAIPALSPAPARAESWPERVEARYRIAFNGFDIGTFVLRATFGVKGYTVESDARISALLGAFTWHGESRSSGTVSDLAARPQAYAFDYAGTARSGSIRMGFGQGNVRSIAVQPEIPPLPGTVPVRQAHLNGVLDPLTAVLSMSRTGSNTACGRKLAVFDGKQRFDLIFDYVRQQPVAEARPSGQPGVGVVCRVRYVPIAGYVMTEQTQHMAANTGIEVVLRPVPSAGMYVPYLVTVPTLAGTATLKSERIDIATRNERIALNH